MVAKRGDAADVRRTRNLAGAVFAVFAAGTGLAAAAGAPVWSRIALAAIGVPAAVVALVLLWHEQRAERQEADIERERREVSRLSELRTPMPRRREGVPRARELSPYDLGVDPEAVRTGTTGTHQPEEYLPRDLDGELRTALAAATHATSPAMIVLRGPSKAGKSRTLFEAVCADATLGDAAVLAPHDGKALARLMEPDGLPRLPPGPVLLWLDDLERFVTAARGGMNSGVLQALAKWAQHVVVVATAGGKGAEELAAQGLSVPIQELYRDPRVRTIRLGSELTTTEKARVRARFAPKVAAEMVEHGIGEYLVAAPELARKLEQERHKPGDPSCPDGAAVVWAAIDWARAGITSPVPRGTLKELWKHYLRGLDPADERIDDRFQEALNWALRPLYQSIALLKANGGYQAYDWLVSYADNTEREINPGAWDQIIAAADPGAAFELGVVAYAKRSLPRSQHAFARAQRSGDPGLAATATSNLSAARAAYQTAIDSGHTDYAPRAAFELGNLLREEGKVAEARAAYQQAIDSGHTDYAPWGALGLGFLLEREDEKAARAAYQEAIDSRHTDHAPAAALGLGGLLERQGDLEGARAAYQRAIDSRHRDHAPAAAIMLGELLDTQGDAKA